MREKSADNWKLIQAIVVFFVACLSLFMAIKGGQRHPFTWSDYMAAFVMGNLFADFCRKRI